MGKPPAALKRRALLLCCLIPSLAMSLPAQANEAIDDFLDMPLEDLLSLEVVSVSKRKQLVSEAAAAVFVITQEDIRRAGVTSIPEALRLAPGIQVGRIDANKWAITSRGFDNQFANKLLVLMDGRTVYTPSFSGVYWDVQDTMLEDIDRIEVIRGPGATIWGANAVNGVINIITRRAQDTQGGLVSAGAGNEEKAFASVRYGTSLGEDTHGRLYLKYNSRDSSYAVATDGDAGDDWKSLRAGFRVDSQASRRDTVTVQGDFYDDDENQTINVWKDPADPANAIYAPFFLVPNVADRVDSAGWNLLGRWTHTLSGESDTSLQVYYDHTRRKESFLKQVHDTLDIEFQHRFRPLDTHEVVWGLGYRRIQDAFNQTFQAEFIPDRRNLDLYSAFAQDEIELIPDRLRLTLGSKFEHNEFTGYEVQPTVRVAWMADPSHTLWGAVSRAVRTPSRVEAGSRVVAAITPLPPPAGPLVLNSLGTEAYGSEKLLAYELGYRFRPRERLSLDLALFHNDYNDLRSFEAAPGAPPGTLVFANKLSAHSNGLEMAVDWRPLEWWRLQPNYSYIRISASPSGSSTDANSNEVAEESSPRHQFSLRSLMDLNNNVTLDLWVYYVDGLGRTALSVDRPVSDYTSVNARLAWHPRRRLELSLAGQNLLNKRHREFVGENIGIQTEVERSVYGQVRWNF